MFWATEHQWTSSCNVYLRWYFESQADKEREEGQKTRVTPFIFCRKNIWVAKRSQKTTFRKKFKVVWVQFSSFKQWVWSLLLHLLLLPHSCHPIGQRGADDDEGDQSHLFQLHSDCRLAAIRWRCSDQVGLTHTHGLLQPLISSLRGQRSEWRGVAGGLVCSGSSSVMRRTKSSFSAQPRQASPQSSRTFFSSRTLSFFRSTEVRSNCCSAGGKSRASQQQLKSGGF